MHDMHGRSFHLKAIILLYFLRLLRYFPCHIDNKHISYKYGLRL